MQRTTVSAIHDGDELPPRPPPTDDATNGGAIERAPQNRASRAILAVAGNDTCADCGASSPEWCLINLGVTLCIDCAGIHR